LALITPAPHIAPVIKLLKLSIVNIKYGSRNILIIETKKVTVVIKNALFSKYTALLCGY